MKIFLSILTILFTAACIIVADHFLFVKKNNPKIIIKNSFKIFFLIYLLNLTIFYNIWGIDTIFNALKQDYLFFLYYFIQGLGIGGIYLLIKFLLNRYFILEKKEITKWGGPITLYVFSLIFVFIGVLGFSATAWEETVYFNASPDQIFITMFTPITGTDPKIIYSFIKWPILLSTCITYIFALIFFMRINVKIKIKSENKMILNELSNRILSFSIALILLISGLTYTVIGFGIDKIFIGYTKESAFIKDNYIDPGEIEITVPNKKRNLIHIYLESIENSFFNVENGGIMQENLMPNLLNLYQNGYNFSHLDKNQGYGGPLKTYGGSFSCGSMVNQFFGLPMKTPIISGQYAKKDKFLPGAVGIGDILDKLNYNQTMMLGADADFGGLTNMFSDHGNFKIMDYKYALNNGLVPKGYKKNWGYEDEKLYQFAQNEITRLASLDEPFHFLMENADTHNPGFAFDEENNPIFGDSSFKEDYGKTIAFSEKHVFEFVKWIQEQDFYSNTTVVIIGDHNTMDGSLFKNCDLTNFTRTTYNLILNPCPSVISNCEESCFYNRQWSNFDMMPTIMASLGFSFQGNRLGLGTNLFSNEKTVFERLGYKKVNDMLVCKSDFYNNSFAKKKSDYRGENLIKQ